MADLPFDPDGVVEFYAEQRGDLYVATRKAPLSPYQKGHGCHEVVTAASFRELVFIAMAERIKASLVAAAEKEFEQAEREATR